MPIMAMAGPEQSGAFGVPKAPARQSLGAIGEASQLVEAALQARTAASEDQRFATTKTLFFALSSLNSALRLELRSKAVGQGKPTSEVRPDCDACVNTLQGVLENKKVEMTPPFCRSVAHCLRQAFELCDSLNAVGSVLDLHKLVENKKAPPDSKIATLEALGEVSKAAGIRVVSVLPESVAAAAKSLKQPEALVRAKAACTLRDLVEGAGGVGSSVHGEALKAAAKAAADKCPEVRVEAYKLCLALAEAAPNLAAPSSPVSVETLVALCVRGLDDESPAARLAAAAAMGASLAAGAEGSAAENERLGVIAARDQEHDDGDGNGDQGGGSGRGSSASSSSSKTLTFSKLKEMGVDMKVGIPKPAEKKLVNTIGTQLRDLINSGLARWRITVLMETVAESGKEEWSPMPPLGDSLTPDTVVQFLSELFRRATFPSPQSREYMAGVAEAFVCLCKRPYMLQRVNSSTVSKLVGTVLDLLDTDRLPQGAGETSLVRTAVEYMVREGISAPLPELAQQLVAREMLQILAEVAGSAPPASGFPPLINEHQIQVCLVELSHLTRALGQACAALKDTMAASLSALLAHPSYGVRFEAAVALASLGSALPWCAAGLLQQCLDEIQQQYDALMAEGILPASVPVATPPKLKSSGGSDRGAESSTAGVPSEGGEGIGGEADADLELDGEGEGDVGGGDSPSGVDSPPGEKKDEKKAGVSGVGVDVEAGATTGTSRGRSTVATKRLRLLLLHGNSAAASLLLQVAKELPMGIPSKVSEKSFSAAEKLILVQFPSPPLLPTAGATSSDKGKGEGKNVEAGGASAGEHPMGVVCSCVRTGWSLMSSLFCVGEEWTEGKADRLCQLWAVCIRGAEDGSGAVRLRGLEPAHELILLDASTRALLWFLRSCPNTLCMVPERLSLAVSLMESAVEAVEGRLKSPSKKQGIICRTLLKALLMECFAWLPPGTFPSSSERLFKWSLNHVKMYTLNDVQSSLLPELLHPDDAVLSVASTTKVPSMMGVGSLVEGEDSDRVLAQVALVSGVTIGPQERDAMVCSAEVWAGRGPSPARRRRELENLPPTPLHAAAQPQGSSGGRFSSAVGRKVGGWRRPLPSSASINVRLLDAAVQVFAASFGQQSNEFKLSGVLGLVKALPEHLQAAAAAASASAAAATVTASAAATTASASRGGKKEPPSFTMAGLMSEEDRKKRDKRHRLSVLNVCTVLLATLKSIPPLEEGGDRGSASPSRHNIDLPWVSTARDVLVELLAWDDSMARRAAAETLALMGLKIGDGFAVYLIQDLSKILRKRPDKKKTSEKDGAAALANANRRAGAMFTLACLKRTMTGQVVLNWFWGDVQRELSVGGDVPQPARTWGLHSISLLVKGVEEEINPTQYSEVQGVVKYLWSIVELLEAHFLDSWLPSGSFGLKRLSASSSASGAIAFPKEGQAVSADLPGLACVLAKLLCTLLPVLQGLEPSRAMVRRFVAMWGVLRHFDDCRVTHGCLELVELLAMFAPGDVAENLPEVMPFLQGVLHGGVGGTSPECLLRAAMCIKLIVARVPEAIEVYRPELELYSCLESVLGSLTWEGAPTWRGVVVSRDVERHFGVRVEAARQVEVAIDTAASVDQSGYRPLHWLLFGKALVVGTGHVQRPNSTYSAYSAYSAYSPGEVEGEAGYGDSSTAASDWSDVVQAARNALARFASPLASSRWQVKRSAVRSCVMVLMGLQGGPSPQTDDRVSCLDVNKARRMVNRSIRNKNGSSVEPTRVTATRHRPLWTLVPPLLCLYLEDLITMACAAATASTDDSELLELQEAGVMMLTEVVRNFAQVPDSDADDQGVTVVVGGKSVKAASLALEQSISQITGAARPALGCKVSPRLAQRGCELVLTLVREGLVKDNVVLRRLVRQVMPEEVVAVSARKSCFERSRRRSRTSLSPSPAPRGMTSHTSLGGKASTLGYKAGRDEGGGHKSPVGQEGFSVRHVVEESYRPQESEVYGAHVPLVERAARLQCVAVLSLVAGGEDGRGSGGGSGSGAVIPDSVRRSLMDALREHLPVLGLHWLANVKDAARLKQGDASGLWPCAAKPNIGAGLTYPPGVKPSFAKLPLRGRWPAMAAAAAAELRRSGPGDSSEAAPFLLSVCVCGLLAAVDGLSRRRSAESSRHSRPSPFGTPSGLGVVGLGDDLGADLGVGLGAEDEDEGQMAEEASIMLLTALRCLFSRPELLGEPISASSYSQTPGSGNVPQNFAENGLKKFRKNRAEEGHAAANGTIASPVGMVDDSVDKANPTTPSSWGISVAVPVPAVVRAVRTLSSFPFLRLGIESPSTRGSAGTNGSGGYTVRLELAAISVLRVLLSGDGAEYVLRASWAMSSEVMGRGVAEKGDEGGEDLEDSDPLALWETVMGGVIGGVQAVLPTAFEPLPASDEHNPQDFQGLSFETAFPSNDEDVSLTPTKAADATANIVGVPSAATGGADEALAAGGASLADDSAAVKSAVAAMSLRRTKALHPDDSLLLTALLPLLARLPPVCPPAGRPSALPSLLLLSVRVVGSVAGHAMVVNGSGPNTSDNGTRSANLPFPVEAAAAVEFVRACVREVWKHGDAANTTDAEDTGGARDVGVCKNPGDVSGDVADADTEGAVEAVEDDGEGDDDWGDEDFQGADKAAEIADTEVTATASASRSAEGNPVEVGAASGPDGVRAHGDGDKDGISGQTEAVPAPAEVSDVSQGNANKSSVPAQDDLSVSGAVVIEDTQEATVQSEHGMPVEGESAGQVVGDESGVDASQPGLVDGDGSDAVADDTKQLTPMINEAGQEFSTSDSNLQAESHPVCSGTEITGANDGGRSSGGEREESVSCVPNARNLVLGAGRAVNELLEDLLRRGGSADRNSRALPAAVYSEALAAAIGVAAEAWGAIASAVPHEAEGLSGPLRTALSCPVERCSVAVRHALFGAVAATVAAATKDEASGDASTGGEGQRAAGVMLRMLVPHALAGLRLEIDRASAAASAPMNGKGVPGEDERVREACILEGVRVSQIAFKAAPQTSHGALLGLLLPLYASALALGLPSLSAAIGLALLHAARSSAAAFKASVAYVGALERNALEGAVRATMMGRAGSSGAGGAGAGVSSGGTRGSVTKKLDLSQYSTRG